MNRTQIEDYAARLDTTGLHFAHTVLDKSGNRIGLVDVPWAQVLVHITRLTGWRITEDDDDGRLDVIPLKLEP